MSVVLDEQTDTVVLEALDFEVPCVEPGPAAELSISCRFCPDQAFWCRAHWAMKVRRIEEFLARDVLATVVCSSCRAKGHAVGDLVEVVPL